ncbi:hypothetical protein JCM16163A_41140 [Paenibacillus sp. YK5]
MNPLDEVITVSEAVNLTGWNVRKIQRLCKSGDIKSRYANGVWLILKSSLLKDAHS